MPTEDKYYASHSIVYERREGRAPRIVCVVVGEDVATVVKALNELEKSK